MLENIFHVLYTRTTSSVLGLRALFEELKVEFNTYLKKNHCFPNQIVVIRSNFVFSNKKIFEQIGGKTQTVFLQTAKLEWASST